MCIRSLNIEDLCCAGSLSVQRPGFKFYLFCPNMPDTNNSPISLCFYPGSDHHQHSTELLNLRAQQCQLTAFASPLLPSLVSVAPVLSKFQLKPVTGTIQLHGWFPLPVHKRSKLLYAMPNALQKLPFGCLLSCLSLSRFQVCMVSSRYMLSSVRMTV